jgi:flagellin-like protein
MNKKGITPLIAVVLLLMMTVAAAGAAFYWLTRMQQQAQSGVQGQQQQIVEEASASLAIVSQDYNKGTTSQNISVDVQNTGGRSISLSNTSIIMVLEDGDGDAVCPAGSLDDVANTAFECLNTAECEATDTIAPNEVKRLVIDLDVATANGCISNSLLDGRTYYYQLKFQKGATISGSFVH